MKPEPEIMWTREQLQGWATRVKLPTMFRACVVGELCRADGRHWSESLGILSAMQRFGLAERVPDVGDAPHASTCRGHWRNSGFRLVERTDSDHEADIAEARALMRIDAPKEDRRAENLRILADSDG